MRFGRRSSPEPEPVQVAPPTYDPASSGVSAGSGVAMPPGFPPPGAGAMPPGFPSSYGGGVPFGFPGLGSLPQVTAAMNNPRVLDAMVRAGRFRTREEAQAWISQMVARSNPAVAQQFAPGAMQPGTWVNGQQAPSFAPGAGQQTFSDLMDQARQKRRKGRGS